MILTHCTHETVLHVVLNMRERDKEEIYGVRFDPNPFLLVNDVMAQASYSWVAWHDGRPIGVGGGAPRHPGVWNMYMFATDEFPRIALGTTRFVRKTVFPQLFGELDARRLQCDSHEAHTDAHRWLEGAGFVKESVRRAYGKDGADYFHFARVGTPRLDNSDKSC